MTMMNWFKKRAKVSHEPKAVYNEALKTMRRQEEKDTRYNDPKGKPQVTSEEIEGAISENKIYSKVRELMMETGVGETGLDIQRRQVGYGLVKYPETLNGDTWSTVETIDHILEESVDRLHYLVMLRNNLMATDCSWDDIMMVDRIIETSIEEFHYLTLLKDASQRSLDIEVLRTIQKREETIGRF